jgi:hypothetical protein
MQKLNVARRCVEDYFPVTPAAFHLQLAYIVKNPYPAERRRELKIAGDGSDSSPSIRTEIISEGHGPAATQRSGQ